MSDMTNEPGSIGPDDVTPTESAVAPTEPLPVAEYAAPAGEPATAVPPAAPADPVFAAPAVPAPPKDHVSISKRWLWIVGGAVVGVILLSTVFAAGVSVGHRAGGRGFDGPRGGMMGQQFQGGQGYGQGQGFGPGQGYGQQGGGYHQRGGMRGWGNEQGLQQNGVPQGQFPGAPDTQQNDSGTPTQ